MGLTYAELTNTPCGTLTFIAGEDGLHQVAFSSLNRLKEVAGGGDIEPSLLGLEILTDLLQEMNAYLAGLRKDFSVKINWDMFSGFQARVLKRTYEIPYGEVMTYGEIAQELGQPGASRAVGGALGANIMPVVIPCHRVIAQDGRLRGYIGGVEKKAFLLTLEGHCIENGRVDDFLPEN